MGREAMGHMDDARVDKENEKAKLPLRKKFVPIEEVASKRTVEGDAELRQQERDEEKRLDMVDAIRDDSEEDDHEEERDIDVKNVEISKEPIKPKPIKVNGLDISSAVSGSSVRHKTHRTNIDNGDRSDSIGKDSQQVKTKKKEVRKEKQKTPNRESR